MLLFLTTHTTDFPTSLLKYYFKIMQKTLKLSQCVENIPQEGVHTLQDTNFKEVEFKFKKNHIYPFVIIILTSILFQNQSRARRAAS